MKSHKKSPFIKPELSIEELTHALFKVNIELSESNKQLKTSEQKRIELYSNLSHDLRSPIASVKSHLEYLLTFDDLSRNEINDTLVMMNNKIESIESMINQIFTFNTISNNLENTINLQHIKCHTFISNLFASYKADPTYSKRRLSLELHIDQKREFLIDVELITRAIDNMMINALKYSNTNDYIQLKCTQNNDYIFISICDSGIGIPAESINKIFERTYRVNNARTPSSSTGCGLGLSITQGIVMQHGGYIECQSQLDKGSIFTIALPLNRNEDM